MRSSTRSLLLAFGTAAALVVTPLAMEPTQQAGDAPAVAQPSAADPAPPAADPAPPAAVEAVVSPVVDTPATNADPVSDPVSDPAPPITRPPGSGMGGDLPPGLLPDPPYPQCPITEDGAWWTDPADPYTCIRPGSIPFHEPTPPGIDPELLEPIFEDPEVAPGPGDDCRTAGTLQCTVTIMGQDYVVTFADGKPVGVLEVQD